MRALYIAAGAVGAAAAVTAAVLVSAGGSTPADSRPAGLYLHIGDGDKTPVQLTGHPYSSVPAEIHTPAGSSW